MRQKVPFVGEEHIQRPNDEASAAKKARGRIIDEVISTDKEPTSWDDTIRVDKNAEAARAAARQNRYGGVPFAPGAGGFTPGDLLRGSGSDKQAKGSATIDWVPINNGQCLRINVAGHLDQDAREEWRRLLDETSLNEVGQFEFNMMQTQSLSLTGLGMLLLFKEQKGSDRSNIKLSHCNREVWQILQWTGMEKYFTIQGAPPT